MSDGFVIVVEGCDKTGKTSLAARLSAVLGWPVRKFGQPGPDGARAEYLGALCEEPGNFIADRFHLGERVYGPLYRGTTGLDLYDVGQVEDRLLARGALLVLLEDDAVRIAERFARFGESFARSEDVPAILTNFDEEWRWSRVAKIRARWHPSLPLAVAAVVTHMMYRGEAT